VLASKQWEEAKNADIAEVFDQLKSDPGNRAAAVRAVALAAAYQDQPLLDEIVDMVAVSLGRDMSFQAAAGRHVWFFHPLAGGGASLPRGHRGRSG